MYSTLKNFRKSRKGNFAVMTALLSVPVLAGVVMAVEYSNLSDNHSRLQHAVDAAALYVGKYTLEHGELPKAANVRAFVRKNFDGNISSVRIAGSGTESSEYSVVATSRAPRYFFGSVLSEAYNQTADAMVPKAGLSSMAVALVLDTTGSMGNDGKIQAMRKRAVDFIDDMAEAATKTEEIKVGIVPFDHHVNVGMSNRNASWMDVAADGSKVWNGCVGSRSAPYTFRDTAPNSRFTGLMGVSCSNAITPLTDDWDGLKTDINALQARGWTYAAPGVMWGLRVLSPAKPFDEAADLDKPARIMVVMADGDNTRSHSLASNNPANLSYDGVEGDVNTLAACDAAKAEGITVYTIAFGTTISTRGQSVLRDCASEAANYFTAKNSAGLKEAFDRIASELTRLRLTG